MFSWICPKCGREVPPSNSDCPFCAEAQAGANPSAPTMPQAVPQAAPPTPVAPLRPNAPQAPMGVMGNIPTSTFQMTGMQMKAPAPRPNAAPAPPQAPAPAPAPAPVAVPQQAPPQQAPLPQAPAPHFVLTPQAPAPPPPPMMMQPLEPPAQRMPNWLGALIAFAVVGAIAGSVAWYSTKSKPESKEAPAAVVAKKSAGGHPYEKYLELSGFRVTSMGGGRSQVQFLVVNHGAAELSDLAGVITLRTKGAGPGDAPAATFNFEVSSVPPFGVKEITVNKFSQIRKSMDMPDWQFFDPTVEITSPQ